MSVLYKTLKISEEVPSGLDVCDDYTPPPGAKIWLKKFRGNAAFTTDSAVMIVWDYGTPDEEIIWSTKGSEHFDEDIEIAGADGTKKVALCCSNGESGPLILSGFAELKVIT